MEQIKLLTTKQAKMDKSVKFGYLSACVHLQPGIKTCPWATDECRKTCLCKSGRCRLSMAENARRKRTKLFFEQPRQFKIQLRKEIEAFIRKADRLGLKPVIRLDATSDCVARACRDFMLMFPMVQFVNYTKDPNAYKEGWPPNYYVVYSLNEKSPPDAIHNFLRKGYGVSQVFYGKLPKRLYHYRPKNLCQMYDVCDGNISDLRFKDPKWSITGLLYKKAYVNGKALLPVDSKFIIHNQKKIVRI